MQSRPSEPSPALSFTYCLFLDDHFPQPNPSLSSSSSSPPFHYSNQKTSIEEALTQVSTLSEGEIGKNKVNPLRSPSRGFLSTDESNSEYESEEAKNSPNKLEKFNHNNLDEDYKCEEKEEIKGDTKSEGQEIDRKSGFSIWSCISPDLGLKINESSCLGEERVTAEKLRRALKQSHFKRIESKLMKLLDRRKRQF